MTMINDTLMTRLLSKATRTARGCWQWTGSHVGKRVKYGTIFVRGDGPVYAHRVSFGLFKKAIPKHIKVCHHCDNGLCINPSHLFSGTQSDNIRDAIAKGRMN